MCSATKPIFDRVGSLVIGLMRDLLWRLVFHLSQRREIEGMEVRVSDDSSLAEAVFERAAEALRLIATVDPNRYGRIRQDIKWILFTSSSGGRYLPRFEGCLIGIDYTRRHDALDLAMAIVHEAMHARLWRAGCRYDEANRERVERICVDAEIAFASKVPGSEEAVARSRQLLGTQWWTHAEHVSRSRWELRALGCPEWLTRLLTVQGRRAPRSEIVQRNDDD
jgi:hypothetical protein